MVNLTRFGMKAALNLSRSVKGRLRKTRKHTPVHPTWPVNEHGQGQPHLRYQWPPAHRHAPFPSLTSRRCYWFHLEECDWRVPRDCWQQLYELQIEMRCHLACVELQVSGKASKRESRGSRTASLWLPRDAEVLDKVAWKKSKKMTDLDRTLL